MFRIKLFINHEVIFDFRENPGAGFRVWEVKTDGKALRQISFPPADEAEKVARWRRENNRNIVVDGIAYPAPEDKSWAAKSPEKQKAIADAKLGDKVDTDSGEVME